MAEVKEQLRKHTMSDSLLQFFKKEAWDPSIVPAQYLPRF